MVKYNFVTVDTLLAKFARELKDTSINESDIIEWIGEALGFMKMSSQNEEAIAIIKVNNYTAILPSPIKYLVQVAKLRDFEDGQCCSTKSAEQNYIDLLDCGCDEPETSCYKDYSQPNEYIPFGTYTRKYSYLDYLTTYSKHKRMISPMRLANNKFFNTLVCNEINQDLKCYYNDCEHQYSIIGETGLQAIRTSFKTGYIIVAYIRPALDQESGYPLIPDEPNHIQAINYYVRWKISESLAWVGREGYLQISRDSEERWLKYIRQANNTAKMPSGLADYEDLKNQSLYLIPRTNKYNNYFGTLNRPERLRF